MKRRIVFALCLLTVAASAFALGSPARNALPMIKRSSNVPSQEPTAHHQAALDNTSLPPTVAEGQPNNSAQAQAPNIPTHVIYGMLFRENAFFKKKAREQEQKGGDAAFFRDYQKNKFKLEGARVAAFDRIAETATRQMSKLDEQAKKVIDSIRAQHPDGKLKEGELPPAPPAQLKELDKQRTGLILQAREQLRAALGEAEFRRLEVLLQEDAAKTIKAIRRDDGSQSSSFLRQPESLITPAANAQAEGE
jgi:hypothetical protein